MAAEYQKYVSTVRNLNAKIVNAEKAFGKGSDIAARIKNQIATLVPREALYFNKNGTIQISRSKELFDKFGTEYLQKATQVKSSRDYIMQAKRAKAVKASDWFQKGANEEAKKRAATMATIEERLLPQIPSISEGKDEKSKKALAILHRKGRRTYEELESVLEIMEMQEEENESLDGENSDEDN